MDWMEAEVMLTSEVVKCGQPRCVQEANNKSKHLTVSRPTLLLENYQPWLDLKVHSKVDASIAEVPQW